MSISKTEGDYKFKVFSKMSRPPQNIPRKCIIWNLHIPINRGVYTSIFLSKEGSKDKQWLMVLI